VTRVGNPPIIQNNGVAAVILGKLMNFDKNISPNENVACASCHMPYVGFSGPTPSVNLTMIAYPGTVHFRAGKRTAQRYTYSSYFPPLQFNATQGAFFGGNFWDSRATGYLLRSPDAEQAQGPPVDPNEMGTSDTACVVFKLSQAAYRPLFEAVWGDAPGLTVPQGPASWLDTNLTNPEMINFFPMPVRERKSLRSSSRRYSPLAMYWSITTS
jgi:cytochrome c peroxidase